MITARCMESRGDTVECQVDVDSLGKTLWVRMKEDGRYNSVVLTERDARAIAYYILRNLGEDDERNEPGVEGAEGPQLDAALLAQLSTQLIAAELGQPVPAKGHIGNSVEVARRVLVESLRRANGGEFRVDS